MSAASRFITGTDTEADRVALRAAMARWLLDNEGPDLHQLLGINRRSMRCQIRNDWLREAAEHIPGEAWPKAVALADRARAFEARRWPRWRRSGPPPGASNIDQALYRARQFGAIQLTARQMFNIVAG